MKKIVKFFLIIVWMMSIFSFSSDSSVKSTEKSDSLIVRTVQVFMRRDLKNSEKEKLINYLAYPVRKCAHLFEYFVLGILIISFCKEYGVIDKKMIIIALIISIIYASSDEIHQLFVSGRSGQITDVFIDTIGSFLGVLSYIWINKKNRRSDSYE